MSTVILLNISVTLYDGIWVGGGFSIPNMHGFRTDIIKALRE